jgi:hypothetical protein
MLGAAFHRLAHLGAEAAFRQRDRLAGDVLPVEPGRARRRDLALDVEIGADGDGDAALPCASSNRRSSTIEPGALSPAASRSGSLMWWVRPSTPSTTA